MPSFLEFVKTGQLGELHCGMSKEEVRNLIGDPEAVSSQQNPQIWKYGHLELTFYRSSQGESPWLVSIVIHFHSQSLKLPGSQGLGGWSPTGETTFEEFRGFLEDSAIRVDGGVTSGPHQHLILGSGVRVTFDEARLYSASYTLRREPDLKQITVAIPRSDLKAIQQEAAATGLSVSKLCSRWIVERASNLQPS